MRKEKPLKGRNPREGVHTPRLYRRERDREVGDIQRHTHSSYNNSTTAILAIKG